jgi:hypothetical protein
MSFDEQKKLSTILSVLLPLQVGFLALLSLLWIFIDSETFIHPITLPLFIVIVLAAGILLAVIVVLFYKMQKTNIRKCALLSKKSLILTQGLCYLSAFLWVYNLFWKP